MTAGVVPARLAMAIRVLLATLGGYALVATWTAGIARALPLARMDAVLVSAMLAFVLYVAVMLWIMATRRPVRTAAWLLLATGLAWLAGAVG